MTKHRILSAALAAAALLVPSTSAFALPVAAGNYFDAKVDNVKAYANGTISVNFSIYMCDITAAKNPSGGADEDDFAVVSSSAAGRDQILSVAESALLSGKTVRVFATDPASGACTIDAMMVLR